MSGELTVALAAVEFGWGSAGKAVAVAERIRELHDGPVRFVGLGTGLGRPVIASGVPVTWLDDAAAVLAERPDVLVSVLDRDAPALLGRRGVPVVFVDSLPFLWRDADLDSLPLDADAYCAQMTASLPVASAAVLRAIRHLRWVAPVIRVPSASAPARAGRRRALVNLGGLVSPARPDPASYVAAVLPPALAALAAAGYDDVHVCGNVDGLPAGLRAVAGPAVTWGRLSHERFCAEIEAGALLLTSPGLTTLLEAGARRGRVVCLPPQNVSQVLNAQAHASATGSAAVVHWPDGVMPLARLHAALAVSEDAALDVIYPAIDATARDLTAVHAALHDRVAAALRAADRVPTPDGLAAGFPGDGATEVARIALATARAARPVLSRS